MRRPHFPIDGRSGGRLYDGSGTRHSGSLARHDSGLQERSQPTEIEKLRHLMNRRLPLSDSTLQELREKVARGDYLTRKAAEATAGRMIDDGFDLE